MKFSDVIGQSEARQRLVGMVGEGRLPHAIMLCGPQGNGKMALALALASYILCENRKPEGLDSDAKAADSCGQCYQCRMAKKWSHPDLHFSYPVIKPEGKPSDYKPTSDEFARQWREMLDHSVYFSMEEWLERMGATSQQAIMPASESDLLNRKLSMKSSQGGYKVVVMWLPERMNQACANKMLKLIEEPPSQTVFIMVCEEPERLLETIRSRVQRIDIKRIEDDDMTAALVARRSLDENTARRVARTANGNWLKAIEQLEANSENEQFLDLFQMLMRLAYMRKIKDLQRWTDNVATLGRERQIRFLNYTLRLLRENFMYNFQLEELCYMTQREEDFARNFAKYITEDNIIPLSEMMSKAIRDIGQNAGAKYVFFDIAMKTIIYLIPKQA